MAKREIFDNLKPPPPPLTEWWLDLNNLFDKSNPKIDLSATTTVCLSAGLSLNLNQEQLK